MLKLKPKDQQIYDQDFKGTILSQASRTVRREQLGNTHSCYSHILSDLATKKLITQEELVADGIFQGVK